MPLRIGFDMDGVLADFGSAFHAIDVRLFGPAAAAAVEEPETEEARQAAILSGGRSRKRRSANHPELRRRRDAIWQQIEATPDFWTSLKPTERGAVRTLHQLMVRNRWEVFFITQRPATEGDTVQRQTQRWLVQQGFDLPSVLVIGGGRGKVAAALRLDYHVDDSAQHCLDVLADSSALPLLIAPGSGGASVASARKLGVGVASSIGECLDILDRATAAHTNPTLLKRLAAIVGWNR
jgi:hypothetical protein